MDGKKLREANIGFFYHGDKAKQSSVQGISYDLLHKGGCQVCPLNQVAGNKNPHMEPYGSDRPKVYMLGEAPGETEDKKGRPFVGRAGEVLKFRIPEDWFPDLRWNNCVRTRPPENRDPSAVEMECCRPSIIKDIEESKPEAIFGFGTIPLQWALKRGGITIWRGRRIPIRVGTHTCWYYPILHPSAILHYARIRDRQWDPRRSDDYVVDEEFAFALDLERAFREVDAGLPDPRPWTIEEALEGVNYVTGEGGSEDVDRVLDFIDSCWEEKATGLDYETALDSGESCLRPYADTAKIRTIGLSREGGTLAFPLHHKGGLWSDKQLKQVNTAFGDFIHDAPTRKISFALPFEMEWSAYFYGEECLRSGTWGDAQSQAYILDERQGGLSLDFLSLQYFGIDLKAISNVDRKMLGSTPVQDVLKYNGLDAKFHRELWFVQEERIRAEGMEAVYREQERRAPTAVLSQLQGIPIDQKEVKELYNKYEDKRLDAEEGLYSDPDTIRFEKKFGHKYNPGASSKDVGKLFRTLLGYHDMESGDESSLAKIDHPLAELTVEWRKATKVLSTYIIPCMPNTERSNIYPDGLLHFILSICKTRTWRTSSEGPNIQNWPKRDEDQKEVRKIVAALRNSYLEQALGLGPDLYVVSFDYAGIQARNIAMESLDKALIQAFWDRYDIHTDWMQRTLEIEPAWADRKKMKEDKNYVKGLRHSAKNKFVFPSFFGAAPKSIAPNLGVELRTAERMQDELFARFPEVRKWQERLQKSYFKKGYVQGLSGFRRHAPVGWNEIINSPIQADEAIIVCDAYSTLSEMDEPQFQAMLEIHDDLTFLWPKKDIERNAEIVIDTMLDVPYEWAHCVPIEVEMSVGPDWASLEEVGAFSSDKWKGRLPNESYKKLP